MRLRKPGSKRPTGSRRAAAGRDAKAEPKAGKPQAQAAKPQAQAAKPQAAQAESKAERSRPSVAIRAEETARDIGGEVFAIGREMVRIPAAIYMRAAELAGAVVLAVWLALWPLLVRVWRLLVRIGRIAQREVTPLRATALAAGGVAIALGVSQFSDYRHVSIGTAQYGGVESIAPPPAVDAETAGSAHLWLGIPLALAALGAIARAARGRASAGWALLPIGIAVVVISLAIDAPAGLDEGDVAVAYEGAEAHLLGAFWVQLSCGAALALLAPIVVRAAGGAAKAKRSAARKGRKARVRATGGAEAGA